MWPRPPAEGAGPRGTYPGKLWAMGGVPSVTPSRSEGSALGPARDPSLREGVTAMLKLTPMGLCSLIPVPQTGFPVYEWISDKLDQDLGYVLLHSPFAGKTLKIGAKHGTLRVIHPVL